MNTSKGSEKINGDGAAEIINVDTVDYRKPAGANEEPHPDKVTVTHLLHDDHKHGSAANAVGGAAAELAEKLQSVNEAVGDTLSRMQ